MLSSIEAFATTIFVALILATPVNARQVFEGRDASLAASTTCTVLGANKCTTFYYRELDVTILNDQNIVGFWSATSAVGSAQYAAKSAGLAATGLTGWVLPTRAEYGQIWSHLGGRLLAWEAQFGYKYDLWTSEVYGANPNLAWTYDVTIEDFDLFRAEHTFFDLSALAVRPGDVLAAPVPEPETYAMMLAGLGLIARLARRRSKQAGTRAARPQR